ncbi:hypothetical protein [Polynucleobacter sinensis]|uniref:hypothetical protein n=1 Tax=Polynucleobacter sinensis TaxID=1743157 RepID=UPI00155E1527|nr:hypothetical protein [Polynucleobacter sinensis]
MDHESSIKQTVITAGADQNPEDPSEFQKYVESVAGVLVPYFGSKFFALTPATFAPM